MNIKRRLKALVPFFQAFFITLTLSIFFCVLAVVDFRAQEGGFPSFTDGFSLTQSDSLVMEGTMFSKSFSISLESLNEVAKHSDITDPLLFPRSVRLTNRILLNLADAFQRLQHEKKEEEYIRNAGII